jgi:sec-independent protein translocase protein TatC
MPSPDPEPPRPSDSAGVPVPADDPVAAGLASPSSLDQAPPLDPEDALPRMTLPEHLDELRGRVLRSAIAVVVAMIASFLFYAPIWEFVQKPYIEAASAAGLTDHRLLVIGPGESFFQTLKLCFLVAAVGVAPFVLWQMWGFIAAGLYEHERRYVRIFFPFSILLFGLGVVAAYVILIPFGLRFLINWDQQVGVSTAYTAKDYISTCLTMVFGMGLTFLLPLVMLFLQSTGIVARETFRKGWRVAVLASVIMGMFLTDPSPITQLMMALPIIGLYFLGVWGGRFVGEQRERWRWWKAWPLLVGLALFVAMLVFADELNDFAARIFGYDTPAPRQAPADPGAAPGTSGEGPAAGG